MLLTFKAIRVLDFTPLIPHSIKRGVKVVVERDDDVDLTYVDRFKLQASRLKLPSFRGR